MNKNQKEVLQTALSEEEKTIKKLKGIYKKALDDINGNIASLMGRTDTENLQSIVYQLNYQKALKTQINGILDTLEAEQFTTISSYLTKCYENGYVGVMYDLHKQGIPIITPINQNQVVKALTNESKLSKNLYNKLGEDVSLLKKRVQNNVSRGFAQGSSYADIARNIASGMIGDYSRYNGGAIAFANRIARTEGHRVQNQAAMDAQHAAKEKGADIVKQWDSTLDSRTRPEHAEADGQIREIDEPFNVGGEDLEAPGIGGSAWNVINCRCAVLQRAKWALDEEELQTLQERAEYYGLDKSDSFEAFKENYLDITKEMEDNGSSKEDLIETLNKLQNSGMSKADYEEYLDIINNNPNADIRKLYANYADEIESVKLTKSQGYYQPASNSLVFDYPKYDDMNKFGTLAHEYGHFFDNKAEFDGLNFKEIEEIQNQLGTFGKVFFKKVTSSSDEFLEAVRKDKEHLKKAFDDYGFSKISEQLTKNNASSGVQDAIDGLFPKSRIRWGHGEKYYNRKYSTIKSVNDEKTLQQAYKELGLDASSQAKTKVICRQYEAASEMWANIMSAEVCGGESLKFVKEYLPNSYEALKKILKGAK